MDRYRWLKQHAKEVTNSLASAGSIADRVVVLRSARQFRSSQKRTEIIALLQVLQRLQPANLCEIGAERGGTLLLFAAAAAPSARLVSIDIAYPPERIRVCRKVLLKGHPLLCVQADSHSRDTVRRAVQWLQGEKLDFLFIDGDHSYEGVRSDYEMYGPLVRPGGIIAFHDIVPDFRTRYGIETASDVGEVPRFWGELRTRCGSTRELIEDPEQDGYGIGVIEVDGILK